MISVNIICVGNLKEKYLRDAVEEYRKRLSAFCKIQIIEIAEQRLSDKPSQSEINSALEKEAERIIQKIPKGSATVAMAIEGKQLSSENFSEKISELALRGYSSISFIIGSSFGLSESIKAKANLLLSMSKMTFPHQLARVMLCEQVYRAFSIINNTKYHK